jgi:hypothetical protein
MAGVCTITTKQMDRNKNMVQSFFPVHILEKAIGLRVSIFSTLRNPDKKEGPP